MAIGELPIIIAKNVNVILAHTAGAGTLGSSVFTYPLTSVLVIHFYKHNYCSVIHVLVLGFLS